MNRSINKFALSVIILLMLVVVILLFLRSDLVVDKDKLTSLGQGIVNLGTDNNNLVTDENLNLSIDEWRAANHPLVIAQQRDRSYQGSDLEIVEELGSKNGYEQFMAAYESDGLTIYGLLTIPLGQPPEGGWPSIIFNHGYIPPEQYQTTERYVTYQDYFAKAGYITFKSDYRGHGQSQGLPVGGYWSPDYTTDVLNAKASVQKLEVANPNKIGFWGHSMGGFLTLRSLVITDDIKAAVIWGGVIGSYQEIHDAWQARRQRWSPSAREDMARRAASSSSQIISQAFGAPSHESEFWRAVDPSFHLNETNTAIQLHHGQADTSVDWQLSQALYNRLINLNITAEIYLYPDGDHNLSGDNFSVAMQRSLEFFDKYVKNSD
jgi:dipeptidyl aminopeptidase/acylaminoacyl peptidase